MSAGSEARSSAAGLWRWFVATHPSLSDPEARARSRLFAALAPPVLLLGVVVDTVLDLRTPVHHPAWPLYVTVVVAYLVNRAGYPRLAAFLAAGSVSLGAFGRIVTHTESAPLVALYAMVGALFLAALFLSTRAVAVLAVWQLALIGLLPGLAPHAFADPGDAAGPLVSNGVAALLILFFLRRHDQAAAARAAEAREREEQMRFALKGARTGTWNWDVGGGVIRWSEQVESLFGATFGVLAGTFDAGMTFIHPDDRPALDAAVAYALAQPGRDFRVEHRVPLPDGTMRWLEARGRAFAGEDGRPVRMAGAVTDISDRKQGEDALRREAAFRRAVIDHAAEGLCVFHALDEFPHLRCTVYNQRMEAITGYTQEEVNTLGWLPCIFPAPDQQERARQRIQESLAGDDLAAEEWFITRKGGERRCVAVSTSTLPADGGTAQTLALVQDLTERRRAEDALRESEERLRLLAEATQEGIGLSEAGRIVDVNPQLAALLGYEQGELIGRELMETVAPELRAEVEARIRTGGPGPYEATAVRRDGSRFPVEVRARALEGAGRALRVVVLRDLTERKRLEDERVSLERRVQHAQKLESLGVLAGGIAHDFNNLLAAILGNIDLALGELPEGAAAQRHVRQAAEAAHRSADLTRQLLAYSGRGRVQVESLDVNDLVSGMSHLLRASVRRTIHLELRLAPGLPAVEGDAAQLQQVMLNLIVNAAEAIGDGVGRITLVTGAREADAPLLAQSPCPFEERPRPGKYVYVEVSDTGCGMDADTQRRLFEPFFTTKFTGRGLGMAAVQGILRGHRGAILVDSTPGCGTTFTVLLPAAAGASLAARLPRGGVSAEEPGAAQRALVLVVDDEAAVREVCRQMLERLGYEAWLAGGGREALECLQKPRGAEIGCVLLDLTMPDMDGASTLAEIQRLSPQLPVVIASGYGAQEVNARLGDKTVAGFVDKPFQLTALHVVLERALARPASRLERDLRLPPGLRPLTP